MLNTPKEYNGKFPEKEQYSQDKFLPQNYTIKKWNRADRRDGSAPIPSLVSEFNTREPRGGRGEMRESCPLASTCALTNHTPLHIG